MRLTKSDKAAFVNAVMDDIPYVKYNDIAHKMVKEWTLDQLPDDLKEPVKKYGSEQFTSRYLHLPRGLDNLYVFGPAWCCHNAIKTKNPKLWAELEELGLKAIEQTKAHRELHQKVEGMIETCTTLKAAKAKLPEFEKYLPAERLPASTAGVPACNVVADLTAAGWPKGKKKK